LVSFISGRQGCLSDLAPAVLLPEGDRGAIVIGDVEHELQSVIDASGLRRVDQLRGDALSARVRGYEQPTHDRKPFARLLQCVLPLLPGALWVRRREREMTDQPAAVLKDSGADRARNS
jgi:hypothetical protein